MSRRVVSAVVALVLAAKTVPALAQLPPYAAQMERLAEILGSLHYLAGLCDEGPSPWREAMIGLLDAEAPAEPFRARIIDRFNVGYASFAAVYQRCTDAAEAAITRYREEGAALAARVTVDFGTPPPAPAP
ncbi:MAG: TIGR02301 family protein [Bauldia sp.]